MNRFLLHGALGCAAALAMAGCNLPGKPPAGPEVPRPEHVLAFNELYAQNCAGCHGAEGKEGPANNLADPEYQALVDDATLRSATGNGVPGSLMPGFLRSAGGDLTAQQVDVLVKGMRARWYKGNVLAGLNPPPYAADAPGDVHRGEAAYTTYCARCHGAAGGKTGKAGSVVNGSFLALMTAQSLRTATIVGRTDLGMPDWRNDIPGKPMSHADVNDVVAWMLAQKQTRPGQPYQQLETPHPTPPGSVPMQPQGIDTPRSQGVLKKNGREKSNGGKP